MEVWLECSVEASPPSSGGQILLNSQRPEMGKHSGVVHLIVVIRQKQAHGDDGLPCPVDKNNCCSTNEEAKCSSDLALHKVKFMLHNASFFLPLLVLEVAVVFFGSTLF